MDAQSKILQRQRNEMQLIHEEVKRKLDVLSLNMTTQTKAIEELVELEKKSSSTSISKLGDEPDFSKEVLSILRNSTLTQNSNLEKIRTLVNMTVADFERIQQEMLVSVDISLRSLEKRLKVYDDKFVTIERFKKRVGPQTYDPVTLSFTDGDVVVDKKVLSSHLFSTSLLSEFISAAGDSVTPIHIARSQQYFKYILMYFTDGEIVCGESSLGMLQAVSNEMSAYGIPTSEIYKALRQLLTSYLIEHKDPSLDVLCKTVNLGEYTKLFALHRACMTVNDSEKDVAEQLEKCGTYEEATQVITTMITQRELDISKFKNVELVKFVTSCFIRRESIEFKVSNSNVVFSTTTLCNRLHKQFNVGMIPEIVSAFNFHIGNLGRSGIGNAMYVGFSFAPLASPPADQTWVKCGFYLSIYNGNLYSEKITPNSQEHKYYDKKIGKDDDIVCWYSRKDKVIGFIINGINLGPAFVGIAQVNLFPIFVLYEAEQTFVVDSVLPIQ
ncbi:hypothetical protein EIN_095480 [Entamoeba invadens IP1]|uniref:SPRY domain-containing protein n=1 Tax=Entamoeba invadens IP1 TaxID=370355 RepID=A0A0A1U629_ENTIV|nr:hypothetical protein EIN_095480 [Entamoeba invadens IP1]ELP87291.1 hypothetical protein EIN_095480 [Entamoeba invadens IP1]|eukprot:XP_004254062.1 hypothetical protein EIN_095480 [Entamoeba invadens IP1]